MKKSLVSIIITTKDEAAVILSCLQSIKRQVYRPIEILVIDNNSQDSTKHIAKEFGAKVFTKGPERSAQRNYGAKLAKGKYLLFLDADMELTPSVIEECVEKIKSRGLIRRDMIAVIVPEKSFGVGFWAQCKELERSFYLNVPWIESARFFRKKKFIDIGGYDEGLTGPEDFELPQRIKHEYGEETTGRISSFILHNEGKLTLAKTLRKKYHYGRKMWEYAHRSSSKGYFDKQANILTRFRLFLGKPKVIVKHPGIFIGMIILKILEMAAITLGAFSAYMRGKTL